MDTDSFIVYIKTDYIYKDKAEDIETRFNTSNYELNRPPPKGKSKKVLNIPRIIFIYNLILDFCFLLKAWVKILVKTD